MKKDKKYLTVLSGGVGGAKFVSGLSKIYDNEFITVIGNIGDDTVMHGLSISPDIDILIYTLAGIVNTDCGWGIKDDTFNTLAALEYLGEPTWFRIGDNDFATHILRSALKQAGMSLTEITRSISSRFGLKITLLPPTSEPVRTRIKTPDGWLDFQEYYVKEKCKPDILDVRFDGALSATLTPEAYKSIEETDMFIIAPSNPVISITPILDIKNCRDLIKKLNVPRLAISPIVGGKSLKGPSDRMLETLGFDKTVLGVANYYRDIIDILVIDTMDACYKTDIEKLGIETWVMPVIMRNETERKELAKSILSKSDFMKG